MQTSYYLRHNPVMVMGAIDGALQEHGRADIGRIAALLPMIMDEKIETLLLENRIQYSFQQLVQTNNMFLSNYNERYISLLRPFYHALSIMLDAGQITICEKEVMLSESATSDVYKEMESVKMHKVRRTAKLLFHLAERETIKELYQLLKVEV